MAPAATSTAMVRVLLLARPAIPVTTGAPVNVIPASEFSAVALKMQSFLPSGISSGAAEQLHIAQNRTGLTNWSTTDRIDYDVTSKDTLTMVAAIGRQASSNPSARRPPDATLVRFLQLRSDLRSEDGGRSHRRDPCLLRRTSSTRSSTATPATTARRSTPTRFQRTPRPRWGSRISRQVRRSRRSRSSPSPAPTLPPTGVVPAPERDHRRRTTRCSTTCSGSRASTLLPSVARSHGCCTT